MTHKIKLIPAGHIGKKLEEIEPDCIDLCKFNDSCKKSKDYICFKYNEDKCRVYSFYDRYQGVGK
jgi:hypothetical protein